MKKIIASCLIVTVLAGCANTTKEDTGTVLGAGIGIAIGSLFGDGNGKKAAMALGAIFGATVGNSIGKSLDERDRLLMAQTANNALENSKSNTTDTWSNPDSGNSGTITPEPAFTNRGGKVCRNFTTTIIVDGKRETGNGQACREQGQWVIQ